MWEFQCPELVFLLYYFPFAGGENIHNSWQNSMQAKSSKFKHVKIRYLSLKTFQLYQTHY